MLYSSETSLQWAAPHLTLIHSFLYIRLSEPYGCIGLRYLSPLAWWAEQESNCYPCDQQSDALSTAPPHHYDVAIEMDKDSDEQYL